MNIKISIIPFLLLMLSLMPGVSRAMACVPNSGSGPINQSLSIPNKMYVKQDDPIGYLMATKNYSLSLHCYNDEGNSNLPSQAIRFFLFSVSHNTDINTQIGYELVYNGTTYKVPSSGSGLPLVIVPTGFNLRNGDAQITLNFTINVRKKGPTPSGGSSIIFNAVPLLQIDGAGNPNSILGRNLVVNILSEQLIYGPGDTTCGFQSGSTTVALNNHQVDEFTGVGSSTGWVQAPLMAGNCNANLVRMTFSGAADPNNPNLFAVSGGATGVGVDFQTFDNLQAVPNSGTPMIRDPVTAGSSYLFQARYMQTTPSITSGGANTNITVNMTYY
ncbi:MAG: fimbrial protein [Rhodanobacter sp.]